MSKFNFDEFIRVASIEVFYYKSVGDGLVSHSTTFSFPDTDMEISVGRTSGKDYISGSCQIYGTSPDFANKLNSVIQDKVKYPMRVILRAGRRNLEDYDSRMFEGGLESVSWHFNKGKPYTRLVFSQYTSKLTNSKLIFTLNKDSKLSEVIKQIANRITYTKEDGSTGTYKAIIEPSIISGALENANKLFKKRTFKGTVSQVLKKLIPSSSRLEWNIVGREIRVNSKYTSLETKKIIVNHNNGLVTKPIPTVKGRYSFSMKINPDITIGSQIQIPYSDALLSSTNLDINTDFLIFKVMEFEHRFNPSSDSTTVECILLYPDNKIRSDINA